MKMKMKMWATVAREISVEIPEELLSVCHRLNREIIPAYDDFDDDWDLIGEFGESQINHFLADNEHLIDWEIDCFEG